MDPVALRAPAEVVPLFLFLSKNRVQVRDERHRRRTRDQLSSQNEVAAVVGICGRDERRLKSECTELPGDERPEAIHSLRVFGETVDLHHLAEELERIQQVSFAE